MAIPAVSKRLILVELPADSPEELDEVSSSIWKHLENSAIAGSVVTPLEPLHFVRADNADGMSVDLLVRAPNKDQALQCWREYYKDAVGADEEPEWVAIIPESPEPGSVSWDKMVRYEKGQ